MADLEDCSVLFFSNTRPFTTPKVRAFLPAPIVTPAEFLAPSGKNYKHHLTGEDNGDAHLKRTLIGHQAVLPITKGKLDLGPWEQIFYAEFDGRRKKRVIVKILGE